MVRIGVCCCVSWKAEIDGWLSWQNF